MLIIQKLQEGIFFSFWIMFIDRVKTSTVNSKPLRELNARRVPSDFDNPLWMKRKKHFREVECIVIKREKRREEGGREWNVKLHGRGIIKRMGRKWIKQRHHGTKLGHFETSKIHFHTSERVSEVSERANEWAQRRARAKRAVRTKRTSERCERTSERTSKWPSTYVSILV